MPSTIEPRALGDRVALIYDMPDQTIIAELDVTEADVLLQGLQTAVNQVLATVRRMRVEQVGR